MPDRPIHLDVFAFPGAMLGLSLAAVDMLRMLNTVVLLQQGSGAMVASWQLLDAEAQPVSSTDPLLGPYCQGPALADAVLPAARRACFMPGFYTHNVPALRAAARALPRVRAHARQCLERGETLLTLGNGAWLLPDGAALQGRQVAVPWYLISGFVSDFPQLALSSEHGHCEDGPLITGGLNEALTPVMLAWFGRCLPPALTQVCANLFQHDATRHAAALLTRQQGHFSTTRDSVMARALAWLDAHLERPYRLDEVAQAAAVSARTLLRHFQQVLGMTPLDYVQQQRCKRARILLETTLDSIPTIARACGYADQAAFRRIFARHEALPPAQYRAQHALRARRERWKVEGQRTRTDRPGKT
ncbi:GlxA family transcriptional regulator [Paucibacter soli]|uniref:GlxA family transcriptional regulator n=1 Tax=Paucibacter soli TaxID=3133433 RepID=UPI0030AEB9D3